MRALILIATLTAIAFGLAASARAGQMCSTYCYGGDAAGRGRVCTTRCN